MSQEQIIEKMFGVLSGLDKYVKTEMESKVEANRKHDDVITHIDGFIKLHETLDIELAALRSSQDRLEQRIIILEKKVGVAA